MAKPKLALIPATQGSKLYSVLPADGVGDFNFSRGSAATRINKDGLIETVAVGKSRLNYPLIDGVVNGCPSHLLEPSRTNLETNSSEFTGGLIGVSILRDVEPSPDGTISSDKLSNNSASGEHLINSNIALSMVNGTSYTCSVFFKSDGTGGQGVIRYYNGSTFHYGVFNLDNGVVSYNSSGTSKIEVYPNGWYRCSISFTAAGTYSNPPFQVGVGNASNQFSYQGASNLSHYFWGVQYEVGSFPTSYIPTTNSAVTRVAETATGAGDASTFNDSDGVFMVEMSALANDSYRYLSLSDGSNSNNVRFNLSPTANQISFEINSGGSLQVGYTNNNTNILLNTKVSIKYKQNDFSIWINGFKLHTDSSGLIPVGLDRINFDRGTNGNPFYGNTKQIQYFDSALNDSDLETLTSWTSFTDLANGQTYSIK